MDAVKIWPAGEKGRTPERALQREQRIIGISFPGAATGSSRRS
ncbi:hypothetical protein CSC36_3005 [Pseudomonas aeruginosa]|nr:hypothetical protein CSC36_3005 [Pseudomonas aeruginosa]